MPYQSTKTYGHEVGLSCAFRQWMAKSHCRFVHGYAISVKLLFQAESLDEYNWVMDFGGLKEVKEWLQNKFDHKLIVASDDPLKEKFHELQALGGAEVVVVDRVGCESFAEMIYRFVADWLYEKGHKNWMLPTTVRLVSVEVAEHGANSAIFKEGLE